MHASVETHSGRQQLRPNLIGLLAAQGEFSAMRAPPPPPLEANQAASYVFKGPSKELKRLPCARHGILLGRQFVASVVAAVICIQSRLISSPLLRISRKRSQEDS